MKKLIPFMVLLAGVTSALAQGVVNFNNNVLAEPPDRTVYGPDMMTSLVGTNFVAQLLYGTTADSLTPHTQTAFFRVATTTQPGTWSGGNRTLAGAGGVGTTIFLQVRAWDAGPNRNISYDEAFATGRLYGFSDVFSYSQVLSSPPASTDTQMLNFRSFSLVPEPSVIGLGLIGIGALFMLRRRKA